jgi:putative flavoprotein involved in K+ transport
VERFEAVVVGAGQAGLSTGHHLARLGVDFAILTDEARVGDNWRRRWDSLRLFTPARHSGLPGMPFPAPPGHLADRDEVADYLERYAERFDLPVRVGTQVLRASHDGDRYRLRIAGASHVIEAENLVIATGAFQRPFVPPVAAHLEPSIHQIHSSGYHNPFELPDGPVLVVGAGNSGAQIALELAQTRKVWLAGRNTGHMPRRVLGRDVFDWAWPLMRYATIETLVGRRMRSKVARGGDALIGIPERELLRAGVARVGRVDAERGGLPVADGRVLEPRVVIWCTGYRPDYRWIDGPVVRPDGLPAHERGVSLDLPGLFFVGLRFQHRLSSSLIGGVGEDAAFIAARVSARCEAALDGVAVTPTANRVRDAHKEIAR